MNANTMTIPAGYSMGSLARLAVGTKLMLHCCLDGHEGIHRLCVRARRPGLMAIRYLHPKGQEFRAEIDTGANRLRTINQPITWEQDLLTERSEGYADCLLLRIAQLVDRLGPANA